MTGEPEDTADPGRPDPTVVELLVRWPAKVAEEVALAPWTVARVRRSLTELPDRLDQLSGTLDHTTATLEETLGRVEGTITELSADLAGFREALDRVLPELSSLVSVLDVRVQHLESMMGELGEGLLGVLGSIPGVRKALRDTRSRF